MLLGRLNKLLGFIKHLLHGLAIYHRFLRLLPFLFV